MAKILVLEDDLPLSAIIKQRLTAEHHLVETVASGKEAYELLDVYEYELLILDWTVPDMSGFDICKLFRAKGGVTPILVLTARNTVQEKELGLDAGADDYLTKPFHLNELSARVRALLRRPRNVFGNILQAGEVSLETGTHHVTSNGEEIQLQPAEFSLLEFFMKNPDQVFSPQALLSRIWPSDEEVTLNAVYICIRRVRQKLDKPGEPSIIETVHGVGYKLRGKKPLAKPSKPG